MAIMTKKERKAMGLALKMFFGINFGVIALMAITKTGPFRPMPGRVIESPLPGSELRDPFAP